MSLSPFAHSSLHTLAKDMESGAFTPTYACPNGPCEWLVFGSPGDRGVPTERGPRRRLAGLTSEIREVIPEHVDAWGEKHGLNMSGSSHQNSIDAWG